MFEKMEDIEMRVSPKLSINLWTQLLKQLKSPLEVNNSNQNPDHQLKTAMFETVEDMEMRVSPKLSINLWTQLLKQLKSPLE